MSSTSNTEMLNQSDINHQETSMTKFEKFSKMVPLLQNHVLPYLNKNTLREYSQCSKECNEEVQKLNTVPPTSIALNDISNGINVIFDYAIEQRGEEYPITAVLEKEFMYDEISDIMQDIEAHFFKYYKHVNTGATGRIYIYMTNWPVRIVNLPMVKNIPDWLMNAYPTMLDGFLEYFKTRTESTEGLQTLFRRNPSSSDEFKLPSEFFKYPFWKNMLHARLDDAYCSIEDTDFVNLHIPILEICCFVSNDIIRQKVAVINANRTIKMEKLEIRLPADHLHRYNLAEVFPREVLIQNEDSYDYCVIGRVFACIGYDGRVLILTTSLDVLNR